MHSLMPRTFAKRSPSVVTEDDWLFVHPLNYLEKKTPDQNRVSTNTLLFCTFYHPLNIILTYLNCFCTLMDILKELLFQDFFLDLIDHFIHSFVSYPDSPSHAGER